MHVPVGIMIRRPNTVGHIIYMCVYNVYAQKNQKLIIFDSRFVGKYFK